MPRDLCRLWFYAKYLNIPHGLHRTFLESFDFQLLLLLFSSRETTNSMFWGWEAKMLKARWRDREAQSWEKPEGSPSARSGERSASRIRACLLGGPEAELLPGSRGWTLTLGVEGGALQTTVKLLSSWKHTSQCKLEQRTGAPGAPAPQPTGHHRRERGLTW